MVRKIADLDNGFSVFEFQSELFVLLPKELDSQFSFPKKIHLLLRSIRGYRIYFIMDDGNVVGYCCLKHNYCGKYGFMTDKDVIINPYYVCDSYRGNHYGQIMIRYAMYRMKNAYRNIWAIVDKDNTPSIRELRNLNFENCGGEDKAYWSWCIAKKDTQHIVFKY